MYPIFETGRDEENLFFSTATEEQACVGHLRGDFGSGTEFWTTWWDHHEELKDQPFRDELDAVVNALRKDGPLKDLRSMEDFCRKRPRSRMSPASGSDYYGFRVDTGSTCGSCPGAEIITFTSTAIKRINLRGRQNCRPSP